MHVLRVYDKASKTRRAALCHFLAQPVLAFVDHGLTVAAAAGIMSFNSSPYQSAGSSPPMTSTVPSTPPSDDEKDLLEGSSPVPAVRPTTRLLSYEIEG